MKIISFIILLFFAIPLYSQGDGAIGSRPSNEVMPGVPDEIIIRTNDFFDDVVASEVNDAYDRLLANSPIAQKKEDLKSLKIETWRSFDLYGELKGYEPVNAEIVTPSYIRLRYLGLHSRFPMRWIFTYYRSPDKGWIVTNIKFDDLSEFFFED